MLRIHALQGMVFPMSERSPIYGFSRGYDSLSIISLVALVISISITFRANPVSIVPAAGVVGFALIFSYSWSRGRKRHILLYLIDDGIEFVDPAIALGLVRWEELEEIRIYATLARPVVAFALQNPREVRRRLPFLMLVFSGLIWGIRRYQFTIQLDNLDDQVSALSSVATKKGVPVVSELA